MLNNLLSGEFLALGGAALASLLPASAAPRVLVLPVKRRQGLFLRTPINSVRFCCCRLCRYTGYLWSADCLYRNG